MDEAHEPEVCNVNTVGQHYREVLYPLYHDFTERLYALLKELIHNTAIRVDHIERRTKTLKSFLEKTEREVYEKPFEEIKDFTGLRIVTYYRGSIDKILDLIRREFAVDESFTDDKAAELRPEEFGYQSVHLTVSLSSSRSGLNEWKRFAGLCAEIQVRSVLQHAWAVLSHTLDYKAASQIPEELRRELFRLNATLEGADVAFTELLKRSDEITRRYQHHVEQGELDLPLNLNSLQEFVEQKVNLREWEALGESAGMEPFLQITRSSNEIGLEKLLFILQAAKFSTISEFESLLPKLQERFEQLQQFVSLMRKRGKKVHAVPFDVLILLVSFTRIHAFPSNFDWGKKYDIDFIESILQVANSQ